MPSQLLDEGSEKLIRSPDGVHIPLHHVRRIWVGGPKAPGQLGERLVVRDRRHEGERWLARVRQYVAAQVVEHHVVEHVVLKPPPPDGIRMAPVHELAVHSLDPPETRPLQQQVSPGEPDVSARLVERRRVPAFVHRGGEGRDPVRAGIDRDRSPQGRRHAQDEGLVPL